MSQTSAQRRARGLRRLEIWLPAEYVAKLDAICEDSGYSRVEVVEGLIDGETTEWEQVRRKKQNARQP